MLPGGTLLVVEGVNVDVVGCVILAGKLEVTLSREVEDGETLDILTSRSGCISGSFEVITIKKDGCEITAKQQVSSMSTGDKLSLVLQVDDKSCGRNGLSAAVIGGIVGAALCIICVVLAVVTVHVKTIRRVVLPYHRHKSIISESTLPADGKNSNIKVVV